MAEVHSTTKDAFKEVKVKFIPIANEYKGRPLHQELWPSCLF